MCAEHHYPLLRLLLLLLLARACCCSRRLERVLRWPRLAMSELPEDLRADLRVARLPGSWWWWWW